MIDRNEIMDFDLPDVEPEEITVDDAVQSHLRNLVVDGKSEWTIYSHRSRLGHFQRYCEEKDIERVSELSLKDINGFKSWRDRDGDGLGKVTLKTQMDTVRVWVKHCESLGIFDKGTSEVVESPKLDDGENVREKNIEPETCIEVLEHLRKFHYAERQHVVFEIIWNATLRKGAVHSLDVDDFDREDQTLTIQHRPETDTYLKKGGSSERVLNLSERTAEVIADWVDKVRPEVEDDYGREPLISTEFGRAHPTTIGSDIYNVTRPGFRGNECSCDPEPDDEWEDCPMTCRANAYRCEDSVPPHDIRAAAITHHLDSGWLTEVVADRADNTPEVIEENYDQASEQEKAKRREEFMDLLDRDRDEESGANAD